MSNTNPTEFINPLDSDVWTEQSLVRVLNQDNKVLRFKWNRQVYQIQPKQEMLAPFVACCLWFGHPDAIDVDDRNRFRTDELKRLRVKYGVFDGIDRDGNRFTMDEMWEKNIPKVGVFKLDGAPVKMVIHDPEGDSISTKTIGNVTGNSLLIKQMQVMQREMQRMQAQIDLNSRAELADNNSDASVDGEDEVDFSSLIPTGDGGGNDTDTTVEGGPVETPANFNPMTSLPPSESIPRPETVLRNPESPANDNTPDVTEDKPSRIKITGR